MNVDGIGSSIAEPSTLLFACVHNAGRSQMAAGFARALGGGRVEVQSAGSAPAEAVNPVVAQAMTEIGIDLGSVRPRRLDVDDVRAADVVITMGCGEACPVVPGRRYEDWDVADPSGASLDQVRLIRDDVRRRVEALLSGLPGRIPRTDGRR